MKYTESKLEQSFIELLQAEGYTYVSGQHIVRKNNQEVLIREDLAAFLVQQHPDLEDVEVEALINELAFNVN